MGVVYHANYLAWFEIGRTEWVRQLGTSYREMEDKGLLLPVIDASVSYKSPARYDDLIAVYTRMEGTHNIRANFVYEVRRLGAEQDSLKENLADRSELQPMLHTEPLPGELLAIGATKHVWLDKAWKPTRIDRAWPELYGLLADGNSRMNREE